MPRQLTIAIPTYNRPEPLRRTLLALRPQACDEVELVVVDNASHSPIEPVVNEVLAGSAWHYRVVRNAANVGMCANILRCFEVAETEWLWALSDDDTVKPDAVAMILQTIQRHPDLLFATYSQPVVPVDREVIHDSVGSFFLGLNSLPQIIFISATLYHRTEVLSHLSQAYHFIETGAPHTALLLLAGLAGTKRKLGFFPQEIAVWQPPSADEKYSQFPLIGMHKLQTICQGPLRRHFAWLMIKDFAPAARLFTHLLRDAVNGCNRDYLSMMLDDYFWIYARLRGGLAGVFWRGPARLAAHVGLRFAGPTKATIELASRLLRGKPPTYEPNPVSLNSYLRLSEAKAEKTDSH